MTALRGVLVLSHGTPARREEVAAFYTAIRHGRPPSDEQLAELLARYDAIGGLSPLTERTAAQVDGVRRALASRAPGRDHVEGGTKYAAPTIEGAAEALRDAGVEDVVGVVLTPLHAPMSIDQYHDRARAALGATPYRAVWSWWQAAGFAALLAARVRAALEGTGDGALVLFSAHSLPVRVASDGADYPGELAACAAAVAAAGGIERYEVCFQSAGRTPEPWVGPDLLEVLRGLEHHDVPEVVVCPVGFVSDHLEVLYDVDVEARAVAAARGITLRRTASLNDDPALCAILADVVELARGGKG